MHPNQVYVIQVSTNSKEPLALPAPPDTLLPSEVKYSASLVRGLGCTHVVLGIVLFLLGVLGSWVEPETCWAGAGVWGGIATLVCGVSGLLAYHLWYKNYTIKAFLVSSVVCVVISILAIILTIYALVNRQEHYYYLLSQAEKHPWFKPYNTDQEGHQLTLSVSANQLVGFILELVLAMWSTQVAWRGVRAEEFSSTRRDVRPDDLQSVASMPQHHVQQVPLAALYQLIQAHPELLGSKTTGGGLGPPWLSGLEDRPSHRSMDYQERVSRFLSHAIEDQNTSFSRSPSTLQGDLRDNSSPTRSSSITGSGGRGSPSNGSAETAVLLPDPSPVSSSETDVTTKTDDPKNGTAAVEEPSQIESGQSVLKARGTKLRNEAEPKSKAPLPKDAKVTKGTEQTSENSNHDHKEEASVSHEAKQVKVSEPETKIEEHHYENVASIHKESKPKKNKEQKTDNKIQQHESVPLLSEVEQTKIEEPTTGQEIHQQKEEAKFTEQNSKRRSKDKKSSSRDKEEKTQSKEECEKTSSKNTDQRKQAEKAEKHRSSKREKLSQIAEEEEKENTNDSSVQKKEKKKHHKREKRDKTSKSSSEKNSGTPEQVDGSPSNKNNPEEKESATEHLNQINKCVPEHVIDIKPPSEFQDS